MSQFDRIKYCSHCGGKINVEIPSGDNRDRHVCHHCGEIHYLNPKIVVGCIPVWEDKILFCKRAIEPRYGKWTLPAGFMENGETIEEGAARETYEEACAPIIDQSLYAIFNLPKLHQVYIMFRASLEKADGFGVGIESLETTLYTEASIPWQELAFPVVKLTLDHYLSDRKTGHFPVRLETIT